ncbi:hypothetical protein AGABI2DRAFT_212373 [Agaricus bisporus var. bisporus H97]|uniref:hypothetical protein n=1 Tax=Agaricus bisporus var. bisporus (strain H97 / ATCC MYA-4626 / FGSC 10389) TaxID=936046 RepID=UPI00029F69C2|nr:hypothetical protein AGABI2DRAFT_212373 [Agaricus bisporus var. bisporus H97]EKV42255.1 hypothetical protein AGABI2DRAFT_212373 [Agaricus bisporus var. bisporus H97]
MDSTCESVSEPSIDLVGGPFAVIESDPGVFSSLSRGLGVERVEVVELYDIEPWAVDHLDPHGLIFCFTWHKDAHRPTDFEDPTAERVWFANQLSDDACATHAILNVLFNCPDIQLGTELETFRNETQEFSPVMRGLAITNSPLLRRVHNSLARPADIRTSLNSIATDTLNSKKKDSQPSGRKSRTAKSSRATKVEEGPETEDAPTYHFIGYVPAFGKVWELDGLKSGPLEVGELASDTNRNDWMDVVRPALRIKMAKYGGSGLEGGEIRFSLLAVASDALMKLTDELEFLKIDKGKLESHMGKGWEQKVDPTLLRESETILEYPVLDGYQHPPGFAAKRMLRDLEFSEMSQDELKSTWQTVIRNAIQSKSALQDEVMRRTQEDTDHVKRTFDYEPFIKGFVTELHNQGLLNPILNLDDNGRKKKRSPSKKQKP